ncbi:vacuolar membrane-associated protein iml1 [Rhodotorula kratochvilovae]
MPPPPVELHVDTAATSDVFVLPSALPPDAVAGDLVAIRPVLRPGSKGKGKDRPLLFRVDKNADQDDQAATGGDGPVGLAARRRGKAQVTVSPVVAQSFSWIKNRIEVELSLIPSPPPPRLCASHVELYFNNLYLSRPDGFALSLALTDKVLHVGQRVALPGSGARIRVGDMWSANSSGAAATSRGSSSHAKNTRLDAAYITDETKFVFRSESARHYIFVEVSQELWQFEEDGSMLLEKCELFLQELWSHYSGKMSTEAEDKRSKGIPTSHVASIILFGRVIYDDEQDAEEERAPLCRLEDGTLYRDFYKVVVDLTPSPPASIIHQVALDLRRWQSTVLLRTRPDGSERLSGRLAHAHESPILEAANLALNSFEEHWIDRDLQRTGQEIIALTAGTTFYQVEKSLLRLTTERMLFHGCGLDLISLSKMPLHTIPLFQFRSPDPSAAELAVAVNDSSLALAGVKAGESVATNPMGFSLYSSSARSPAGAPHRFPLSTSAAFRPSSLRQAHAFPGSPPLRDPRAPSPADARSDSAAAAGGAPARIAPIQVPDDQRDPLYFDPPPPRSSAQHARGASASLAEPSSVTSAAGAPPPARAPLPPAGLETSLYYHEPMFVFPHFFGTQIDKPHRVDRFMPRARCYELMSQGVTERVPIALPLLRLENPLAAGAEAGSSNGSSAAEGYLTELERRQQRREAHDARALGARDPAELGAAGAGAIGPGGWADERESGATTSGTSESGGESGWARAAGEEDAKEQERERLARRAREEGGLKEEDEEDEEDEVGGVARGEDPPRSGAAALGIGVPSTAPVTVGSVRSASSSFVGRQRAGSVSTTSSAARLAAIAAEDEDERGRRTGRNTPMRKAGADDSVGRSKTPVPRSASQRRARAPSISASIRTIASGHSRADGSPSTTAGGSLALRKASTPALIARLTGGPAAAAVSSAAGLHSAPSAAPPSSAASRPGWLSLFGRATTLSNVASPAAQVAVARVDVQANLRPEDGPPDKPASVDETLAVDSPVLAHSRASVRPASRARSRAETTRSGAGGKTQPISIGSKLGPSGGASGAGAVAERPRPGAKGGSGSGSAKEAGRMSSSLKAYEPGAAMRRAFGISGGKLSVSARFNPSKPGKRSVGLADQARRWAGILVVERRSLRLGVKWRSIARGAILPLTTDYLPSADTLTSQYSDFRYTVPTSSVTSSALLRTDHPKRSHILTLVTELICQRLAQGFQICTPANATGALDAINIATSKTLPDVLRDIQEGEVTAVYLSLSNQIHRIWYDRRTQAVCVKILRRRRTWAKTDYAYRPLIWTRGSDNYEPLPLALPYPVMMDPRHDWQYADRLVAGAEKPDAEQSVRYRRTRLVLLPAAKVPDRDYIIGANKALQGNGDVADATIQVQGFYVLLELIENARWAPAGVEKEPLSITQTNLDAPGWAASMAQQQLSADSTPAPTSPVSAATATAQPRNWLARMQSRANGVKAGDEPSAPSTPLLNGDLDLPPGAGTTPSREAVVAALNKSESASAPPASSSASSAPTSSPPLGAGGEGTKRVQVQMTYAVVLDFDPSRRSDRAERVLCHLDRSHNVLAAYHVELAWLTASGKIVDNAIQSWARQMARYGLNLVEVSMRSVLDRHNPFQKPSIVRPCVLPASPWTSDEEGEAAEAEREGQEKPSAPLSKLDYLAAVLRRLDFFLDLGADSTFPSWLAVQYSYRRGATPHSQYIHRSGTVLATVLEDADGPAIAYAPNRVCTNHRPDLDLKRPMERLVEMCGDEAALRRVYDEVREAAL